MKNSFLILSASILLFGCVQTSNEKINDALENKVHLYENSKFQYSILIPDAAFIPNKSVTKDQIFFGNIGEHNTGSEFDIDLYAGEKVPSCTPTIMGTNTIQNYAHETGGNTVFGIVTGKGYPYEMHTFDDSLCMPPYHPNDEGNYENNHVYDGVGAYVLCSQKEEKTVLICISQMTDNPKLAEEIFSTFRWVK